MDDIIVRSRYPRHSAYGKRRKKITRDDSGIVETIVRQAAISALILLIIVSVKSINAPITNYLTDKLQTALFKNIELKSVLEGIDSAVNKVRIGKLLNKEDSGFDEEAVPVSAGFTKSEENKDNGAVDTVSLPEERYQVQEDIESAVEMINKKYKFIVPVEGTLSSSFGERTDPTTKTLKFHKGIDIEADSGASIKASLDGEVIEAGSVPTYGKYIKIDHGEGIITVYAHCSQLIAKKGQKVKQGDIIARVGDTGVSVGSHLHFEIWKDGKPLNPTNFINIPLN